jgi:hypothetical protein
MPWRLLVNISYVAGLFDGEGYVRINRWEKPNSTHIRYNLVVGINMTYRPIIEMFGAEFGGGLHSNRYDLRSANQRCGFCWVVASRLAAAFLRKIQPFVIVKKDQVDLALEFQANVDGNPYVPTGRPANGVIQSRKNRAEILAFREDCYRRIFDMKKETFPPFEKRPLGRPKKSLLHDGPMDQ